MNHFAVFRQRQKGEEEGFIRLCPALFGTAPLETLARCKVLGGTTSKAKTANANAAPFEQVGGKQLVSVRRVVVLVMYRS